MVNIRKTWIVAAAILGAASSGTIGCKEKPGFYPNRDAYLRQPVAKIRADGAQRTYPAEAQRGRNLATRSQIGYMAKTVDVGNFTGEDWHDVEVWVNQQYVIAVPVLKTGELTSIPWDAMYDHEGKHPPRDSHVFVVNTVEVFKDGTLYDVKVTVPSN